MRWLVGFLLFNAFLAVGAAATGKKRTPTEPEPEPRPRPRPKIKKPKPRPPSQRRPFKMEFTVKVSGMEKWFFSEDDARAHIKKNSHIGPGSGPPKIFIKEHPIGYRLRVEWPDSSGTISPKDAKVLIEGTHKRLHGRVSDVKVTRR